MIFGSTESFAIEAELREVSGKWTYGRLRFWVAGNPFGDFDDTADLATSARYGREFLAASLRRTRADLDEVPAAEVYEMLYGRFIVLIHPRDTAPVRTASAGHWDRDPFLLDGVGDSALVDDFAELAVRRADGSDRIIVKCFDDERVLEAVVAAGVCDQVVESYCAWVEAQR